MTLAQELASPGTPSLPAASEHGSSASVVRTEAEYEVRMAHFSAFRAFENGLVERCARHDSNVRPLRLELSASGARSRVCV